MFLDSLNYTELTSTYHTNKDVCRTIMAQALAKAQEPEQKKLWEQNGDFYNTNYGEYELTEARVSKERNLTPCIFRLIHSLKIIGKLEITGKVKVLPNTDKPLLKAFTYIVAAMKLWFSHKRKNPDQRWSSPTAPIMAPDRNAFHS